LPSKFPYDEVAINSTSYTSREFSTVTNDHSRSAESASSTAGLSYRSAGVDVEAGDQLVDWLVESETKEQPRKNQIISGIGGFAAVFRASFSQYKKPCLVAATDGVGTKILLAAQSGRHGAVGQDLVAMCVNDLVCSGAEPLFFLDYYATGRLQGEQAREFLASVRAACHSVNCALIGGETAEMPGVYQPGDFDAAGFAVGVVDEDHMLGPKNVRSGDVVLGVSSSGFHSNGYSLLRKVFAQDLEAWMDRLLAPTALYVNLVLELHRAGLVKAAAHITGGGMENLPRVLPRGLELPLQDWAWPQAFVEVQDRTQMSREEMLKTLNCGVGMALVVAPENRVAVWSAIERHQFRANVLGELRPMANAEADAQVVY
jgi:phosphoribosylformylglycinamidine cyclo-ligase